MDFYWLHAADMASAVLVSWFKENMMQNHQAAARQLPIVPR